MQEKSRDSSRGYLIGLSATVFLSFTGILISYLNRTYNLPSLVLAFWRDLSVVLGLLIVFAAFKRDRLRLVVAVAGRARDRDAGSRARGLEIWRWLQSLVAADCHLLESP